MAEQNLIRMDNMGIVVESLDKAVAFFTELGMRLEGRTMIEGPWAGRVTGLGDQQVEIAMMIMPDGHSRLGLSRFIRPEVLSDHCDAPFNALGYLSKLTESIVVITGCISYRIEKISRPLLRYLPL